MLRVNVPPTAEQGSYNCKADDRKDALWQYNKAREHDGLPPINRMPNGTTYAAVKKLNKWMIEYVIQYSYKGMAWEDCSTYSVSDYENPRQSALADLKEYRISSDGSYRLITRKVLNPDWEVSQQDQGLDIPSEMFRSRI